MLTHHIFPLLGSDREIQESFDHGMHFFCPKPVDTKMLRDILMMRAASAR